MKTNELRIGNWVNYYETDTLFKVTGISDTGLQVENETASTWIEIEAFAGVILTPEILENCGFKYIYEAGAYADKSHALYDYDEDWELHPFCTNDKSLRIRIQYLHQLQNLIFSLTSEELIINL